MFNQVIESGQLSRAHLELFPFLSAHLAVFYLLPKPAPLVMEGD